MYLRNIKTPVSNQNSHCFYYMCVFYSMYDINCPIGGKQILNTVTSIYLLLCALLHFPQNNVVVYIDLCLCHCDFMCRSSVCIVKYSMWCMHRYLCMMNTCTNYNVYKRSPHIIVALNISVSAVGQ